MVGRCGQDSRVPVHGPDASLKLDAKALLESPLVIMPVPRQVEA
jgi:hypothetical protein